MRNIYYLVLLGVVVSQSMNNECIASEENYLIRGELTGSLRADLFNNSSFRGNILTKNNASNVEIDLSKNGISFGYSDERSSSDTIRSDGFVSFSFSPGFADFSFGARYISLANRDSDLELFISSFGKIPSRQIVTGAFFVDLYSAFGVGGESYNYSRIKIEYVRPLEMVYFNPYLETEFSDYFGTSWKPTTFSTGLDLTYIHKDALYLSAHLESIHRLDEGSQTQFMGDESVTRLGASIRYSF